MPLILQKKEFSNLWSSQKTDTLVANVAQYVQVDYTFEASVTFTSNATNKIQISNGDTLTRTQGSWIDDGFGVGMYVLFLAEIFNGTVTDNYSVTLQIIQITNNTVILRTNTGLNPDIKPGFYPTEPFEPGAKYATFASLIYQGAFEGAEFKFNLIPNTEIQGGSINSIIDGTAQVYRTSWSDITTLNQSFTKLYNKSGSNEIDTYPKVKYIEKNTDDQIILVVTHIFEVWGLFENSQDLELGNITSPEWFENQESLTDWIEMKVFPDYNDQNVGVKLDANAAAQLGNVGYLNENYNGLPSPYSFDDLLYDTQGQTVQAINSCGDTSFIYKINHPQGGDTDVKFKIHFFYLPNDANEYENVADFNNFDNLLHSCRNSGALLSVGGNSGIIQGKENKDGARMDMGDVIIFSQPGYFSIVGTWMPNAAFREYMKNRQDGDKRYMVMIATSNPGLDTKFTTLSNVVCDINEFICIEEGAGPYRVENIFYEHPFNINSTPSNPLVSYVEDIIRSKNIIRVAYESEFLNQLTIKLEVVNNVTQDRFEVDSYVINTSDQNLYPVINGVQQINVDKTRGFQLKIGSEENFVKISRYLGGDTPTLSAYNLEFAFAVRWEDYIQNLSVSNDFFDTNELNNGKNQDLAPKDLLADWSVNYVVYSDVTVDGEDLTYRNEFPFEVKDYDYDAAVWENSIKHYNPTGQDLAIDTTSNAILNDDYTEINGIHKNLTGSVDAADHVGEIRLEAYQEGSLFGIYRISTLRPHMDSNPLVPLVGETLATIVNDGVDKLVVKCRIDFNRLPANLQYKVSSRVWCKDVPTGGDGGYTEGYTEAYSKQYG
ncbi:MAG: hypothetical protein WDZ41_01920 [Candidatus Babeliales bacterium]